MYMYMYIYIYMGYLSILFYFFLSHFKNWTLARDWMRVSRLPSYKKKKKKNKKKLFTLYFKSVGDIMVF
jgi:hypothetical protein